MHKNGALSYETPTPYWCWVGSHYLAERIAGEYAWLWFTLFVSFFAYLPLFFWARGDISPDPERWWRVQFHDSNGTINTHDGRKRMRAMYMLAYPAVYCVLVLPLSVVRWITFDGTSVNSAANFVVVSMYNLSGFCNVVLFTVTRPNLLLMRPKAWYASRTGRPPHGGRRSGEAAGRAEEGGPQMQELEPADQGILPDDDDIEVDADGRPAAAWSIPRSPASSVVSSFFATTATPHKNAHELTAFTHEAPLHGPEDEVGVTVDGAEEGEGLPPNPDPEHHHEGGEVREGGYTDPPEHPPATR
jgi:hypothetical protein